MARLTARRLYFVNDINVPKVDVVSRAIGAFLLGFQPNPGFAFLVSKSFERLGGAIRGCLSWRLLPVIISRQIRPLVRPPASTPEEFRECCLRAAVSHL